MIGLPAFLSRLRWRFLLPMLVLAGGGVLAQDALEIESPEAVRQALASAQSEGEAARQRAERLEAQAAAASDIADRTAREAAGVAARIQQAEAAIAADEARIRIIDEQRRQLRQRLAAKQRPLVRLTASLQRIARRPPVLSLFRPGSVRETMYLRAILSSALPEVERRTAALRQELAEARRLQLRAGSAVIALRASQAALGKRRTVLAALETRQRLASRAVGAVADRESERALALAERARDLDGLAGELTKAGQLRSELAALPGPVLRPARPETARVADLPAPAATRAAPTPRFALPVAGRLVAGFGETGRGLPASRGIALAVRQGAQAVAPAPGRVVFAGPYQGYGSIVIIEHEGGWTSLITGLAQLDMRVGDRAVEGSPLGIAGAGRRIITLELRRAGVPVNPLDYITPP